MKKIIALALALCMIFSLTIQSFAGHKDSAQLKFDKNGNFQIMVLADVQDSYPMEKSVITFIEEALDYVTPDLVVFCGDNTVGGDPRSVDEMVAPLVERGVPFTFVFGNHDHESGWEKEDQLVQYQKNAGCLAYDADPALSGCAAHNIPILSSDGSELAFNLWMFDSGSAYRDEAGEWLGYDWVRADQIEWYNKTREELKAENGGELVPSMAFQHIIPQEPCEKIFYPSYIGIKDVTINMENGTHLSFVPDITKYDGVIFERSCPSYGNDGQWDAMVNGGDVLGLVVGHDHINNFVADVDGIDLIQTPGVTYNSYYNEMVQGARIIEINEENPWEYETYNITTNEMAIRDGSQLGEGERNDASYKFFNAFENIFMMIYEFIVDFFKGVA